MIKLKRILTILLIITALGTITFCGKNEDNTQGKNAQLLKDYETFVNDLCKEVVGLKKATPAQKGKFTQKFLSGSLKFAKKFQDNQKNFTPSEKKQFLDLSGKIRGCSQIKK